MTGLIFTISLLSSFAIQTQANISACVAGGKLYCFHPDEGSAHFIVSMKPLVRERQANQLASLVQPAFRQIICNRGTFSPESIHAQHSRYHVSKRRIRAPSI